jgi:hypothetical protein
MLQLYPERILKQYTVKEKLSHALLLVDAWSFSIVSHSKDIKPEVPAYGMEVHFDSYNLNGKKNGDCHY